MICIMVSHKGGFLNNFHKYKGVTIFCHLSTRYNGVFSFFPPIVDPFWGNCPNNSIIGRSWGKHSYLDLNWAALGLPTEIFSPSKNNFWPPSGRLVKDSRND